MPDEVGRQELYRQVQQIRQRNHLYHTELVTRDMRNSNYMIIQPDGSAMVPMDTGERVNEYELGSLLNLSLQENDGLEISLRTFYLITMNARNTKGRVKEH